MASDNASYFSNAYPSDNATFDGNIYRLDTANPKYALGFRVARADGNVYRYSQFSTLISAARLVAPTNADFMAESANCLVNGTAATAIAGQVVSPGVTGGRFIQVTSSSAVKNQYAGGYLIIESGTGSSAAGTYRIKGNTASGTPAATSFYIELYDVLQTTLDATTDICVITLPYSNLVAFSAASTATNPVGVTVSNPTATYEFAFIQTWGVCACLMDAHVALPGDVLTGSLLTAGAVGPLSGGSTGTGATTVDGTVLGGNPVIGYAIQTATASVQAPMYLTISR